MVYITRELKKSLVEGEERARIAVFKILANTFATLTMCMMHAKLIQ